MPPSEAQGVGLFASIFLPDRVRAPYVIGEAKRISATIPHANSRVVFGFFLYPALRSSQGEEEELKRGAINIISATFMSGEIIQQKNFKKIPQILFSDTQSPRLWGVFLFWKQCL